MKPIKVIQKLNEAIEPKYEKSNEDYNSFLREVRYYTGSYDYQFGGKVSAEVNGTPVRVDYFYYLRPFVGGGYNLVANVLTPLDFEGEWVSPYDVQEAIDKEFEQNSPEKLTNREIKEKILQVLSTFNNEV